MAEPALVVADAPLMLLLGTDAVLVTGLTAVTLAASVNRDVGKSGSGCSFSRRDDLLLVAVVIIRILGYSRRNDGRQD
jgi:hypothetical protein